MTQPTDITFEDGYSRLQSISSRLGQDTVPVSETCDLLAEAKGLEQALTTYLNQQRARIEAIERGEGIMPFKITNETTPPATSTSASAWVGHAERGEIAEDGATKQ